MFDPPDPVPSRELVRDIVRELPPAARQRILDEYARRRWAYRSTETPGHVPWYEWHGDAERDAHALLKPDEPFVLRELGPDGKWRRLRTRAKRSKSTPENNSA